MYINISHVGRVVSWPKMVTKMMTISWDIISGIRGSEYYGIQLPILYWSQAAIFLFDKEK